MRKKFSAHLYGALLLLTWSVRPSPGECETTEVLTMDRAIELALSRSLDLRGAEIEVDGARGALAAARSLRNNPELSGGAGLRLADDGAAFDASAGLSQTFALGRPRRHRIAAATAGLASIRDRAELLRHEVAIETSVAWIRTVTARLHVALARTAEGLTRDLHHFAEGRRDADAGTDLEVNLAVLEQAQARRLLAQAIRDEALARIDLLRAVSFPENSSFGLPDVLPEARPVASTSDQLVDRALETRLDLAALGEGRAYADAEVRRARSEAVPDLSIEATYDLEAGSEHIVGLGLSIPLPLFDRNQSEIAEARARARLAELAVDAARLDIERHVRAAFAEYQAARDVAALSEGDTVDGHVRNLDLLRASFEEGNVGLIEVLLVQRELIAARRDAIEAAADLHAARAELELAVGSEVR